MLALATLVLSAANSSDRMRMLLFMLVLVAIALILAGGIIAVITLYRQRKAQ